MIEAVSKDLATYPFTTDTVLFCLYQYYYFQPAVTCLIALRRKEPQKLDRVRASAS